MTNNKMALEVRDRTLEMVRPFNAPRELLYRAFSDGEALRQWFGPEGWPITTSDMDFRVGGSWHYCMTGPDGTEGWGLALYEEITPTERIQYRDTFSDADRTEVPPASDVTLAFEDRGDGTSTLRWTSVFESNDARDQVIAMGMEEGAASTLENLERYLASVS